MTHHDSLVSAARSALGDARGALRAHGLRHAADDLVDVDLESHFAIEAAITRIDKLRRSFDAPVLRDARDCLEYILFEAGHAAE